MSKYTFSLSSHVKDWVEWRLIHYHEDKRQLEESRNDMIPNAMPSYSLTGGVQGGQTSDPTQNAALRMATNQYLLETGQTINAIGRVLACCDKTDIALIDLVYWKRAYSVPGAAMVVSLSQNAAYKRINNILCAIALEIGYVRL